jgi:hypothetical protein
LEPGDFGTATFAISEVVLAPGAADHWHRHSAGMRWWSSKVAAS